MLKQLLQQQEREFEEKYGGKLYIKDENWATGFLAISTTIKSLLLSQKIELLEKIVEIVKEVQKLEPESNGRFNACYEILSTLQETINGYIQK